MTNQQQLASLKPRTRAERIYQRIIQILPGPIWQAMQSQAGCDLMAEIKAEFEGIRRHDNPWNNETIAYRIASEWHYAYSIADNQITFSHRAVVTCNSPAKDGRSCCVHQEFQLSSNCLSSEQFQSMAKQHFVNLGWQLDGELLCPQCNPRR